MRKINQKATRLQCAIFGLTTLRLFVTVCETRNIVRASEQANLVGSAISKRLSALEETVGVKLLQRRRRGMEPTDAGRTLLEHAREILATADRIERAMAELRHGLAGRGTGAGVGIGSGRVSGEDVAGFLAMPPGAWDVRVTLEERVSPDIVRGSRRQRIAWHLLDAANIGELASVGYRSGGLRLPCIVTIRLHLVGE